MAASGMGTATGGAEFTAEDVRAIVVEPLLAEAVVLRAMPRNRIFPAAGAPVQIPKIATAPLTTPWVAENAQIAESDPTTGEVTLLPSSLKSLKVMHRFSNELARAAARGINVGDALAAALAKAMAAELDKAFLTGAGTSNTITGLAATSGVQDIDDVGAPTIDVLYDALALLMGANANPATSAWFMHPRDWINLRKLREGDGTGAYLVQPDPTAATAPTLLGIPVHPTTVIPANGGTGTDESEVILADLSQVAVAHERDIEVRILDQLHGDYDQQTIRIVMRWDIAPLNEDAVVVLRAVIPPAAE